MLTPRFRIEQSEESVTLFIHAPYTDVNESEVHVDQNQVCFFASPYYLRVHLPGPVVEDEKSKGTFDVDVGDYVVTLSKCNKGQKFENLDMINSLMKPPNGKTIPSIEVIGESCHSSSELSDFDWFIDQEVPEPEQELLHLLPTYGFANGKSGIFKPLEGELPELLDLLNPDATPNSERENLQEKWEDEHFSPEHFLADWAEEDELILPLLDSPLQWKSEENDVFTPEEQERLLRLPNIDILQLTPAEQKSALLNLAEIIFCWAHEQISTLGDTSPESARSIRRLSSTLSWLRSYSSARKMILSCFRRALCVPLYRNWSLAQKALEHTVAILRTGRVRIIKSLLSLNAMFAECESYHVHSQLFLEPYCIWLQSVPDASLANLAAALEKVAPEKADLGWDLEELEAAGKITLEEEKNIEILTKQLKTGLNIKTTQDDSDDSSSSDEWESSSYTGTESSSDELEDSSCSNEED